jgi:uncharacterized metal-binding protein YceD (DUF177 family)
MSGQPEFSHIIRKDQLGEGPMHISLSAKMGERAALAKRFDLVSLDRLDAKVIVSLEKDVASLSGKMVAHYVQACVASAEPVPDSRNEAIAIRFVEEAVFDPDAEIELDIEECDTVEFDGQSIDVGEAVAQSLGLSINPYPRSPAADAALKGAGVGGEVQSGPFASLAALKDKLGGN